MKKVIPVILAILLVISGWSLAVNTKEIPSDDDEGIKWISITQLNDLASSNSWKKDKRKVVIDLYTDWCGWCKVMDAQTFSDKRVAEYVNENYYAVKFNAEMRDSLLFGGKYYKFHPSGSRGINELAWQMGNVNGSVGYPTIVFLNEDLERIQALAGFQKADNFHVILTYFGEDHHKTTPWETYQKKYLERKNDGEFRD